MNRSAAQRFRGLSKPSRVVLALVAAAPVMGVVIGLQRYFPHRVRGGLRNVASRLAAAYGEAWSLELRTRPEGGAVARVALPARAAVSRDVPRLAAALP